MRIIPQGGVGQKGGAWGKCLVRLPLNTPLGVAQSIAICKDCSTSSKLLVKSTVVMQVHGVVKDNILKN